MGKNGISDEVAIVIADDLRECVAELGKRLDGRLKRESRDSKRYAQRLAENNVGNADWMEFDGRIVQLRYDLHVVTERVDKYAEALGHIVDDRHECERRIDGMTIGMVIRNTFRRWWKK